MRALDGRILRDLAAISARIARLETHLAQQLRKLEQAGRPQS
jgi:hypothetical protein